MSLATRKTLIKRTLNQRIQDNPLQYYWPHAPGCDGKSCEKTKNTYKDYFGNEYEVIGCPQYRFHISTALTEALFGANRSGKTTSGAVEAAFHSTGQYPSWYPKEKRFKGPTRGRIFASDFGKGVGEVIEPALKLWFPKDAIKDKEKNNQGVYTKYWIRHISGKISSFDIMTYEQDPYLAEGWSGHWVWYDEPPPRAHRIATMRGLTDFMGREFFTLTPLKEPWIFDEVYDNPETDSIICDIRHNLLRLNPLTGKYIGLLPEAIARFESSLTEEDIDARIHGKFRYLAGRIWKIWDRQIHTFSRDIWTTDKGSLFKGEPPRHWSRIMLIDPHDRKPHALLWVAIEPEYKRLFLYREAWLKGYTFADVIKHIQDVEMGAREKIDIRIIDPNFGPKNQANTNRTVRETFENESKRLGYPMRFSFGDDHKELGRKRVEELLWYDKTMPISLINRPQMQVASDLEQCIYQVEHYIWDEYKFTERDPKEKPKEMNTDFPDLLHYLALHNVQNKAEVVVGPGNLYK